jgi:hypothetical protein
MLPNGINTVWIAILTTLFPTSDGDFIYPLIQERIRSKRGHAIYFEVNKGPNIVLVAKVDSEMEGNIMGKTEFLAQLNEDAEESFQSAWAPLYWIAAIGSEWRFGYRLDDGPRLRLEPLIDWHESLHDEEAQKHFKELVDLVHGKEELTDPSGIEPDTETLNALVDEMAGKRRRVD